MRRWWLVLLLISTSIHAELTLYLEGGQPLTPAQRQASEQLLAQAYGLLPPTFIQRLDQSIAIGWYDQLPAQVYGRATSRHLELNRRFLPALTDGSAAHTVTGRKHDTLYQELVATLIHELTHFYDRAALWTETQKDLYGHCQQQLKRLGRVGISEACRTQSERQHSLSDDPQLLDLAGWNQQTGQRGQRSTENGYQVRNPDIYELSNPREFVAVNLEYFLLDPEYACRRPSLQRYFQQHFAWQPPNRKTCSEDYPLINAGQDFGRQPLLRLNPQRVYEVDYLVAEANQEWASRWGHSMLRLVICAPDRPLGPACRLDLSHHLVLSFRAFVNDVQLSSWDGLVGEYPSRLFILPLDQVIEEYTRMELRSLASVPLKLSRTEIHNLVQRSIELHWSYDGVYYFLSNNCAVETLNLLRSGTQHPKLQTLDNIFPNGLLELMSARGLADYSKLDDPKEALRLGYRFDSYRKRYEQMLQILQQRLSIPQQSLEAWFALTPAERSRWIAQADLPSSAALLLLEQGAYYQHLLAARDEVKNRYLSRTSKAELLNQADATLRAMLANTGHLSRPAELLERSGYGIPQADEWTRLEQATQQRQQTLKHLGAQLDQQVRHLLEEASLRKLQAIEANLAQIAQNLRQLHQQRGGFKLP